MMSETLPAQALPVMKLLFSMWFSPRKTIREVLENNNFGVLLLLTILGGMAWVTGQACDEKYTEPLRHHDFRMAGLLLLEIFILGPLLGLFVLIGSTFSIFWTGKLFGGQGSLKDIATASAWSAGPKLILFWVPLLSWVLIFFYPNLFVVRNSTPMWWVIIPFAILLFAWGLSTVWSLFTYIKTIAEAQKFSFWKSLVNCLLSLPVTGISLLLIGLIHVGLLSTLSVFGYVLAALILFGICLWFFSVNIWAYASKVEAPKTGDVVSSVLGPIGCVAYGVLGLVQLSAIDSFFAKVLGWNAFISGFVAWFVTFIPLVGTTLGIIGAVKAWGWSVPGAIGLYFGPYVVLVLVSIVLSLFQKNPYSR